MPTVHVAEGEPVGCFWCCCAKSPACSCYGPGSVSPFLPGGRLTCAEKAGCIQAKGSRSVTFLRHRQSHRSQEHASQSRLLPGTALRKRGKPTPEGTLFSLGKTGGAVHSKPTDWIATAVCGVFIQTCFERKVKGASALYCVYIKKSFVCFYYFNYCYKKPAIFNMWFGEFCLFFLFGGFLCFSRFCFFCF